MHLIIRRLCLFYRFESILCLYFIELNRCQKTVHVLSLYRLSREQMSYTAKRYKRHYLTYILRMYQVEDRYALWSVMEGEL